MVRCGQLPLSLILIVMKLLIILFLKTQRMKTNWKSIVLYVIKVIELLLAGAAGGAASQLM